MLKVLNLRTEYKANPLGLETITPGLSWEIVSSGRNVFQTAWQVHCAPTHANLEKSSGLLWDSGKVTSDQSVHVAYGGKALMSGQRVCWHVKVWDNKGEESAWSEISYWEMGLLCKSDWKASWIGPGIDEDITVSTPCPFLRKEFDQDKIVVKATVYVTCRGLYELSLNGIKVSDDLFTPGWTSYHKRLQYQVYDVTDRIHKGKNAIGIILGDGWYRGYLGWQGKKNIYGRKTGLLFQLRLEYVDGSSELICSDGDWKSATGPILQSDIYNGETYDARMELSGWNKPGYEDGEWMPVTVGTCEHANLVSSEGVPVRITETVKPVKRFVTPKGELVFDLGQNIVGWVCFRLSGTKGTKIILNHAEILDREGNFCSDSSRVAKAEDIYIFKGEGIETFEPHFTFHGFRYIRVTGYEGNITLDDIEGRVIHSDMKPAGEFECSDPLVNRLQKNIQWSLRGNFLDIPTDCPQRDERMGWTGDAQVFASTACFNRDAAAFYIKWMKDMAVDQRPDGSVPWVVPNIIEDGAGTGWSDGFGATGWADAAVIIPWSVYLVYGDRKILGNQYLSMKAWEEYMIRESGDSFIFESGFHFGDWLSFAEYYSYNYNAPDYGYAGATTEKELIATAYFYHSTQLMQKIAAILEKREDEQRYASLLPQIKAAFQKEFLTGTGRLTSNTQTAYVLALAFGLLPVDKIAIAVQRLVKDINYFGHLTTGFLGTPLICQTLTEYGHSEIAYKLLFNQRYPSWLYPVTMGATTIWERWDSIKPDGSFQDGGMNSFNHYAYGAVGDWLYSYVAGLRIDPENPGYKRFIVKPYPDGRLTFAKAVYSSVYGTISVYWKQTEKEFELHVDIPANTMATVYLPCKEVSGIMTNGKPLEENPDISRINDKSNISDISRISKDGGRVVLEVGSGRYDFRVKQ